MGKYTRKAKMTADVALTESYLGVRTRAKSLALQRLQSAAVTPPQSNPDAAYLELRSRRLEKHMQPLNSKGNQRNCGCRGKEDAEIGGHEQKVIEQGQDLGIEGSFGENNLDFEVRERGTRESTPCSSTKATDSRGTRESTPCSSTKATDTPGSTSKQAYSRASTQRVQNAFVINGRELEEFFAREEQSMQRRFIEKYNFDIVKDSPLSGRYEWVAVSP